MSKISFYHEKIEFIYSNRRVLNFLYYIVVKEVDNITIDNAKFFN
jgi:preprotein translocase subunit SecA